MTQDIDYDSIKKLNETIAKLGIKELRKGQDDAIFNLLKGNDCYTVLPTGHGKTGIFVIPTLVKQWKTIVFTPLVALMQDHLNNLLRMGLSAGQISSVQTPKENEMTLEEYKNGNIDFLFIAPERLENEKFHEIIDVRKPDMVAVDEVHCLSEHGLNFRSSYCRIIDFISKIDPEVILTLTATSPKEVEEDVIRLLGLDENVKKVVYMPPRLNLKLTSKPWQSDYDLVKQVNKLEGSGIIYFSTVKRIEEFYNDVGHMIQGGSLIYNGQMSNNEKSSNQELWSSGEVRVIICTNAFGLGINKPDTRFVIMRDIPGSIEELSQAFGRAGRDGKDATCILYFDPDSIKTQEFFIQTSYPSKEEITAVYNTIKQHADADQICHLGGAQIAEQANVSKWYIQAVMANLQAFGAIERKDFNKAVQIKFKKPHIDDKYNQLLELIKEYGIKNEKNYLEIEIEFLASEIGLKPPTLKKRLKDLNEDGYIEYIPPPRSKPTKILKPISCVDFDLLKEKRQRAFDKLDLTINFHRISDNLKHQYMTNYFNNEYK